MVFLEAICLRSAAASYKIRADGTFESIPTSGDGFQNLWASIDYHPSVVKVELGMTLKLTWQATFKCELRCKVEPVPSPITPCTCTRLSMLLIMVGILRDSCLASRHRMCSSRLDHGEHDDDTLFQPMSLAGTEDLKNFPDLPDNNAT